MRYFWNLGIQNKWNMQKNKSVTILIVRDLRETTKIKTTTRTQKTYNNKVYDYWIGCGGGN